MSRTCEDCGHSVPNDANSCPNCGCPVDSVKPEEPIKTNDFNVDNGVVDHSVLNFGKSTEAEATVTDLANAILKWGEILAVLVPILNFIVSLISAAASKSEGAIIGAVVISIIVGIIYYFIIKFLAKLIWAIIMLFVNMSTTLKRIEIQIKKDGTN